MHNHWRSIHGCWNNWFFALSLIETFATETPTRKIYLKTKVNFNLYTFHQIFLWINKRTSSQLNKLVWNLHILLENAIVLQSFTEIIKFLNGTFSYFNSEVCIRVFYKIERIYIVGQLWIILGATQMAQKFVTLFYPKLPTSQQGRKLYHQLMIHPYNVVQVVETIHNRVFV